MTYLCNCKSVSSAQIQEAVAAGARGFGDLSLRLGVGLDCGECVERVNAVLQACLTTAASSPRAAQSTPAAQPSLTVEASPAAPSKAPEPAHAWFAVDL